MEGNRIEEKAMEGITSQLRKENGGVISSEARNRILQANYKNPIIPNGFKYLKGEWNNGFVIQNKADDSCFVWDPVGSLEADGTLDGINFNEKFGRRTLRGEIFSNEEYHEEIDEELTASVKKYGGVYISAFLATEDGNEIVFKKQNDKKPYTNINQFDAIEKAKNYARNIENVGSCLPNGAVYDSLFKWLIQFGKKTSKEVNKDSTNWGNYWNSADFTHEVRPTGSNENWQVCNIYDLAGNCDEWSRELYGSSFVVLRTGWCKIGGFAFPASARDYYLPIYKYSYTSFRSVLYLK